MKWTFVGIVRFVAFPDLLLSLLPLIIITYPAINTSPKQRTRRENTPKQRERSPVPPRERRHRTRTPPPAAAKIPAKEDPAVHSGSEEGEIEEE